VQTDFPADTTWDNFTFEGDWQSVDPDILLCWSWAFADIGDEITKSDVARMLVQLMLGVDPYTLATQERQLLRLSGIAPSMGFGDKKPVVAFDA
jgi:hypothetical protein